MEYVLKDIAPKLKQFNNTRFIWKTQGPAGCEPFDASRQTTAKFTTSATKAHHMNKYNWAQFAGMDRIAMHREPGAHQAVVGEQPVDPLNLCRTQRHPAVVRHLAADRRCLPAAALRPNVSQGSEAWCRLQRAKCRAPRG